MSTELRFLFTPVKIGQLTIENRIVFPPSCPQLQESFYLGTRCREESIAYYAEKAKGGVGLIIHGVTAVHETCGPWLGNYARLNKDEHIKDFVPITEAVHKYNSKIFCQLWHPGISGGQYFHKNPPPLYSIDASRHPWGPSEMAYGGFPGLYSKEMTHEEIDEIIESFGQAALRVVKAGFDGVEVHAGPAYLIEAFYNFGYNKRTDEYGGPMENRARLFLEIVQRVRKYVGDDFIVGCRVAADALMPGHTTVDDVKEIMRYMISKVKLDYVNTNVGTQSTFPLSTGTSYETPGYTLPFVSQLKEVVDVPLIVGGRLTSPHEAEEILAKGLGDLVYFNRQMYADPEFANKAKEGRFDDIRPCVQLGWCAQRLMGSAPIHCALNPAMTRERHWGIGTLKPAETKKKILVIGGGPAGMELARIAAQRGHAVSLYEKEPELGGRLFVWSKLPGHELKADAVSWFEGQLKKYGVKMVPGKEVSSVNLDEILALEAPDVAVLATGSIVQETLITGLTGYPVQGWETANIIACEDILRGKTKIKDREVLILDLRTDIFAIALAEYLLARGNKVKIVNPWSGVGSVMGLAFDMVHGYDKARKLGLEYIDRVWLLSIAGSDVTLIDPYTAPDTVQWNIKADAIVPLLWKSNKPLYEPLKQKVKEVYIIGDAECPGGLDDVANATFTGQRLARKL